MSSRFSNGGLSFYLHFVEEDLDVAVGGGGVVAPEIDGPLHPQDDPGQTLAGRAAVLADGLLVVALAQAGVGTLAAHAGAAALAAVAPQASLQDVVADGGLQVALLRVARQQLVERVQRVGDQVGVLGQRVQPLLVGRRVLAGREEEVRVGGVTPLDLREPADDRERE